MTQPTAYSVSLIRKAALARLRWSLRLLLAVILALIAAGCASPLSAQIVTATVMPSTAPAPTLTLRPTASPLPSATFTASPSPTVTLTATITATPEPPGCLAPPEDYALVEVNGWTLNRRTLAMLEHAQRLYGGELEITGHHVTQGSYNTGVSASFGTHDGGGAVDLSVMRKGTYTVLWDDIEPLIRALRGAGFAAWLREYGELYPDSPYHIHAVAIGDRDLSPAARAQLDGEFGYFRGYTGVPIENGPPAPDRHGGPMICQWMLDLGYSDLRPLE